MILLAQLQFISHRFIDFFSWQRNVCLLLTKNYWEFDFIDHFYRFCSSLLFADRIIIVRWSSADWKIQEEKNTIEFFCYSYYYYLLLSFGFCSNLSVDDKRDGKEKEKKNLKSISFQIANNIDNDRFFWKHSFKTKI